jgi:phage gpG-like protein
MKVSVRLSPPIGFILGQAGAFRAALADLTPLWEAFKPIMSAIEEEQFASEGHGAWPGGPAYHGLVRTGALRGSLVDGLISMGPMEMVWGSDVFYAIFHQAGTDRMPARPVIDLRGEDHEQFAQASVKWLNEVANRTWGAI